MYNFWGFLLQTLSVSIVALIILLLKRVFEDKLSPRWQYSIWVLLAIRILVPVNVSKYIIPQLALWIEVFKENIEKLLKGLLNLRTVQTILMTILAFTVHFEEIYWLSLTLVVVQVIIMICICYVLSKFRQFLL